MGDKAKRLHKVRVRLVAETEVEIDVWASDDEEPTDLTKEEQEDALRKAFDASPEWEIDKKWEVK